MTPQFTATAQDLRVLYEHAGIGIARVGLDGSFRIVNAKMCEIFGYNKDEFVNLRFQDLTHPDELDRSIGWLKGFIDGTLTTVKAEKRYIHKNRRTIYVNLTVNPVRNAAGEVEYFASAFEDVTERKRSDELLVQQKHILELIARNTPLNDILAEIIKVIEKINPGCQSTIYLVENGRLYLGAAPSFPESFVGAVNGAQIGLQAGSCGAAAFTGKRVVSTDVDVDACWGPYRQWFKSYGFQAAWSSPVVSSDGKVLGTVSMCWREKRAPQERDLQLADVAVQLMQTAIEKAKSENMITHQQVKLVSSSKMAALGEMGGALAHEINNPLTIIHGNAVLLEKLAERNMLSAGEVLSAADRIKSTAMRITKIVKGLKAFARDGDQDPFKHTPVREILDDALELCRERFKNHGVTLSVEPCDSTLMLNCRAVQIGQVLLNLLSNAFDAVEPAAEKWVKVSALKTESKTIEITIEDSGSGIAPELRDKVMQPFFTTKPVGKGTGLGLSIASGIAASHGGSLRLDEASQKTRFVLSLPL